MVSSMIQDDAAQPGGKPGFAPEIADPAPGGQESLLDHIAGLTIVADHPVGDIEHPLLVAPDKDREGVGITAPAAGDENGVLVSGGPVLGIHWIRYLGQGVSSRHRALSETDHLPARADYHFIEPHAMPEGDHPPFDPTVMADP
jgi:hypothetical protein